MVYDSQVIPIGVFLFGLLFSMGMVGLVRSDYTIAIGAGFMLVLTFCLSWPNRYGIDDDRITWHHGFAVNKSINLNRIDRIRPGKGKNGLTFNKVDGHWLASGRKELFVAADDQAELIRDVIDGCPHLRLFGHEYRRAVELQ